MLAAMYRDQAEALRLRIETLEAKLAERDAALAARDAELSELAARVERLRPAGVPGARTRRLWPILAGAMALLVGASALLFAGMKPRAQAGSMRRAMEPKTTTGVAACDEYLFRLELCISRLDPAVRDALSTSLRTTREGWWAAGATASGQEKLAATCEQALDGLALNPLCE
jgi:hypothetical protein